VNRKWRKRVQTGVLKWRDRDGMYGFTNLVEAGHVGWMAIEYIHEGAIRNRRYLPQINLTTLQVEAVSS